MTRKRLIAILAVLTLGLGAVLAFAVFGVHKAFIDDVVAEADPFAQTATTSNQQTDTTSTGSSRETGPNPSATEAEVIELSQGTFSELSSRYSATGTATMRIRGSEGNLLFGDDFDVSNGPDLKVFLSASETDIDDSIKLDDLAGNIGTQNYDVAADTDLTKYRYVVIWCERFSVGFGATELV